MKKILDILKEHSLWAHIYYENMPPSEDDFAHDMRMAAYGYWAGTATAISLLDKDDKYRDEILSTSPQNIVERIITNIAKDVRDDG